MISQKPLKVGIFILQQQRWGNIMNIKVLDLSWKVEFKSYEKINNHKIEKLINLFIANSN